MWSTNKVVVVVVVVVILGNLSKDLFELRTSIRSGLFFLEQYFCPNVWTNRHYNKKEPIRNTNLVFLIYFKIKKFSLQVDVRLLKTS